MYKKRSMTVSLILLILLSCNLTGLAYCENKDPEEKLRTTYVEDPIRGIVYMPSSTVDTYQCGEPHTIKVVISDCDYTVHVKVKQSGATLFDDTLSEGEDTGWLDADQEETWVEIDHPGTWPPAIYYEGKICMWVS